MVLDFVNKHKHTYIMTNIDYLFNLSTSLQY